MDDRVRTVENTQHLPQVQGVAEHVADRSLLKRSCLRPGHAIEHDDLMRRPPLGAVDELLHNPLTDLAEPTGHAESHGWSLHASDQGCAAPHCTPLAEWRYPWHLTPTGGNRWERDSGWALAGR